MCVIRGMFRNLLQQPQHRDITTAFTPTETYGGWNTHTQTHVPIQARTSARKLAHTHTRKDTLSRNQLLLAKYQSSFRHIHPKHEFFARFAAVRHILNLLFVLLLCNRSNARFLAEYHTAVVRCSDTTIAVGLRQRRRTHTHRRETRQSHTKHTHTHTNGSDSVGECVPLLAYLFDVLTYSRVKFFPV